MTPRILSRQFSNMLTMYYKGIPHWDILVMPMRLERPSGLSCMSGMWNIFTSDCGSWNLFSTIDGCALHMEWHQPTSLQIHMTKEWSRVRYRPSGTIPIIIGRVLQCTPHQEPGADTSKVAIAAVDTLLWQALASVIVPGFSHHHDISIADQQIFLDRSLKILLQVSQ